MTGYAATRNQQRGRSTERRGRQQPRVPVCLVPTPFYPPQPPLTTITGRTQRRKSQQLGAATHPLPQLQARIPAQPQPRRLRRLRNSGVPARALTTQDRQQSHPIGLKQEGGRSTGTTTNKKKKIHHLLLKTPPRNKYALLGSPPDALGRYRAHGRQPVRRSFFSSLLFSTTPLKLKSKPFSIPSSFRLVLPV